MHRITWRSIFTLLCLTGVAAKPIQAQPVSVACLDCAEQTDDRSLNLLMRRSRTSAVTLRWDLPTQESATMHLYVGDPLSDVHLRDLGALGEWTKTGWSLTHTFNAEQLRASTLLTVLTQQRGGRETLLDWRAWRNSTLEALAVQQAGPPPTTDWDIDLRPVVIAAETGHGHLPRGLGPEESTWWPLADQQANLSDLDLDGHHTGIPGLGISVEPPWEAAPGTWHGRLVDAISTLFEDKVAFDELELPPLADRVLRVPGTREGRIRYYYARVTLYTNASHRSFRENETLGAAPPLLRIFRGPRTFFSHETSARLDPPDDPRLWSSYSERELGQDPHLLELLRHAVANGQPPPGLAGLSRETGDGGAPRFRVRLRADVQPDRAGWGARSSSQDLRILSVGLVGARTGRSLLRACEASDAPTLKQLLPAAVGGNPPCPDLDLNAPPRGYRVAPPLAEADTRAGALTRLSDPPPLGARLLPPAGNLASPPGGTRADFVLSARLQAGALSLGRDGAHPEYFTTINAFAQYVVRIAVLGPPELTLRLSAPPAPVLPEPTVVTLTPPPSPGLLERLGIPDTRLLLLAPMLGLGLGLLLLLPGLRELVSELLRIPARLIRLLLREKDP